MRKLLTPILSAALAASCGPISINKDKGHYIHIISEEDYTTMFGQPQATYAVSDCDKTQEKLEKKLKWHSKSASKGFFIPDSKYFVSDKGFFQSNDYVCIEGRFYFNYEVKQ